MTLTERQCLHTSSMGKLICFAGAKGLSVKVVEWNRLLETQKEYVASGVSKTLNSKHLENCATDLYIIVNGAPTTDPEQYRLLGEYWESLGPGHTWGGRWGEMPGKIGWDVVHFQQD